METKRGALEGKKVALLTLGCKVNAYETAAMQALLLQAGAVEVGFEETADIYIVNTCSVTNIADRKSRQMLRRARRRNPQAVVAAAGCYAQAAGETLKDADADVVIGNNQKKDIVSILERYFAGEVNILPDMAKETQYEEFGQRSASSGRTRAYLKIQDGCNRFCSYCIIPYTRGRIRSREVKEVLREAERLAEEGYRELVLTGIHLSSYGQPAVEGEEPLLELIARLNELEAVQRIRLGSLEPRIVTEKFVKTLSECKKVCPQFHLSLQSGSDAVLRRMNRGYTAAEYEEGVRLLRTYYDRPAVTTDLIVGFPQETEEEFEETLRFAERIAFAKIHVFKYSRRKGTVADRMGGQIPEQTKNDRSDRLLFLAERLGVRYRSGFLGSLREVLFEDAQELDGRLVQTGYTERYIRVAVPADATLENRLLPVELIREADGRELLLGRLACPEEERDGDRR